MKKHSQKGITAIELIIALAIFSIITVALYGFIRITLIAQSRSLAEISANNEARRAMFQITQDLRGTIQSEIGSYPIEEAANQSLIIYTSTDEDHDAEKISYYLSGTDLIRSVIQPQGSPATYPEDQEQASVIARYVQNNTNPIFYYYDKDYTGTQDPIDPENIGDIRLIKINLLIDTNLLKEPPAINIETEAQLRNLKDNL